MEFVITARNNNLKWSRVISNTHLVILAYSANPFGSYSYTFSLSAFNSDSILLLSKAYKTPIHIL